MPTQRLKPSDLDINFQDKDGKTALIHVFSANRFDAIAAKFLLSNKASLSEKDKDGKTALQHAIARGNTQYFDELLPKKLLSSSWDHTPADWKALNECKDANLANAMLHKMYGQILTDTGYEDRLKRIDIVKAHLLDAAQHNPTLAIQYMECLSQWGDLRLCIVELLTKVLSSTDQITPWSHIFSHISHPTRCNKSNGTRKNSIDWFRKHFFKVISQS